MATKPSNDTSDHLKYKTWVLKVSIHCEGCKKKVHKILHNIDGVFTVSIDSQHHKVSVTGNVEAEKLIKKLERAGKHAELVQENVEESKNGTKTEKSKKKKKKKSNAANVDKGTSDGGDDYKEDILEKKDDDGNEDEDEKPNSTDNGDKKKKKKGKKENKEGENDKDALVITESSPTVVEPGHPPIGMMHLGPPYGHLYPYYPTQSLGLSYSTSHPSGPSSYYASPMYAYNASYRPPPPSYQTHAYNNYDHEGVYVENDGAGGCSIM